MKGVPLKPKTHCKNGHERTPENIDSDRSCKVCRMIKARVRRHGDPNYTGNEELRRIRNSEAQKRRTTPKPDTYIKHLGRHEHRMVAEQIIGRPLQRGEIVHHIDSDKHNNRPGNLKVMTQPEHVELHRLQGEFTR